MYYRYDRFFQLALIRKGSNRLNVALDLRSALSETKRKKKLINTKQNQPLHFFFTKPNKTNLKSSKYFVHHKRPFYVLQFKKSENKSSFPRSYL